MALLNYYETSQITRRAVSTLRKDVMNRTIPFIKIGRSVYFDKDEIEEWINSKRVPVADAQEVK